MEVFVHIPEFPALWLIYITYFSLFQKILCCCVSHWMETESKCWNFQQVKSQWDFCLELIASPGFKFWQGFCFAFGSYSMQLHIEVWIHHIHMYVDMLSQVCCHQVFNLIMITFLIIILKYQLQAFTLGICLLLCMEYLVGDTCQLSCHLITSHQLLSIRSNIPERRSRRMSHGIAILRNTHLSVFEEDFGCKYEYLTCNLDFQD